MTTLTAVINRYANQPIYRQLSDLLEARIVRSAQPGDRLPSEAELSQEFDVNRLTVRRALSELHLRGLIDTVHGKGSFVATPRVRYDVSAGRDASFTHVMTGLGHRVSIRLLSAVTVHNSPLSTELETTGDVLECHTLRLVDDQPWSLSTTSLDAQRFPGLAEQWSGETSLFDFLLERHRMRMQRATRTFAAGLAEPAEAQHLHIRTGAPILEMRGLNVDQAGKPVAFVAHKFRGDRVQFTVDLA